MLENWRENKKGFRQFSLPGLTHTDAEDQMLNNVLCLSTHPKGHAHSPGLYSEIVVVSLHQSFLKLFVLEGKIFLYGVSSVLSCS